MLPGPERKFKRGYQSQTSRKPPERLPFQEKNIGEQWLGTVETTIEVIPVVSITDKYRHRVIFTITVLCACLIFGIAVHSAMTGHEERLDKLLDIAWKGLIVVVIWACGKATLKILQGVKFDAD